MVFEQDTPLELIMRIRPRFLSRAVITGSRTVVGREVVESAKAAKSFSSTFLPGHSTERHCSEIRWKSAFGDAPARRN